jgi:arylamine N-acetyltransferase
MKPDRPTRTLLEDTSEAFSTLPYENLTKLIAKMSGASGADRLRRPLRVMEDHVSNGTGGTCFSLTSTLVEILTAFGFDARPVMGDMRHGPDIHCAALVEAPFGSFILDPGYLVGAPVPLGDGASRARVGSAELVYERVTPSLVRMCAMGVDGPEPRCTLKLGRLRPEEFEQHWQRSFDAPGMNSLHLCRVDGSDRLYAHNRNMRIDGAAGRRNLKLGDGWAAQVSSAFGIDGAVAQAALELWSGSRRGR